MYAFIFLYPCITIVVEHYVFTLDVGVSVHHIFFRSSVRLSFSFRCDSLFRRSHCFVFVHDYIRLLKAGVCAMTGAVHLIQTKFTWKLNQGETYVIRKSEKNYRLLRKGPIHIGKMLSFIILF